MSQNTYHIGLSILFWLLWTVGLLILLLFGFFCLIMINSPVMAAWNGLVVLAEGFVLFKTARHFVRKDLPMSTLLLWVGVAAVGIPLLASGGCMMLDNMRYGLRIGG